MRESQKMIEYRTWLAAWLVEHPLPPKMSKKARWRAAQNAWRETRGLEKRRARLEKQAARRGIRV